MRKIEITKIGLHEFNISTFWWTKKAIDEYTDFFMLDNTRIKYRWWEIEINPLLDEVFKFGVLQ